MLLRYLGVAPLENVKIRKGDMTTYGGTTITVNPGEIIDVEDARNLKEYLGDFELVAVLPDGLLESKVTLTSAQLLDLGSTQIELIPAPGVDKVIVPIGLSAKYNYGTVTYDNLNVLPAYDGNLDIPYDGFSVTGVTTDKTFITLGLYGNITEDIDNLSVKAYLVGVAPTVGDGTMTIIIQYKIADFS